MKINIKKYSKVIFILLAVIVISCFSYFKTFSNYELIFYDFLFKARPPLAPHQDLVIIEISDDTLKNLGQWPLPRDYHAGLVDVLNEFGAKMIIFDVFFSEPSIFDELFSESMKKAGNVYIPQVLDIDSSPKRKYGPVQAKGLVAGNDLFKESSNFGGHINTFVDADGKVRRIPLFIQHDSKLMPQLALNTACEYLGLDIEKVSFKKREIIIDDKLHLPTSFSNSFLVNFPDVWISSFLHLSYFDILKSYTDLKTQKAPNLDLNILKDKVCIIGLTAAGTPDTRAIPLENSYPLVGLQASVFSSIVGLQFIKDLAPTLGVIISLLAFFLALFVCLRLGPVRTLLVILAGCLAYLLLAAALFIIKGIWIDIFLIFFIVLTVYIGSTIYKFLFEIKKRQLLEKELEIAREIQKSFLPKDINEFGFVKIAASMQPAKFVAGDLYDIIPLDEKRLGVFIGDVAGKGASASLIMAQTVSLFRVFARTSDDPAATLNQLNKELCRILEGRFVTALYLIVDIETRQIKASCAGHNPIVVYSAKDDGISEVMPVSGPPLGIMDSIEYESFIKTVNAKDKFLLYTDGVSEARNKKAQEFGIEKVKDLLLKDKASSVNEIVDDLKKQISRFCSGAPQHDDITLILLEY